MLPESGFTKFSNRKQRVVDLPAPFEIIRVKQLFAPCVKEILELHTKTETLVLDVTAAKPAPAAWVEASGH